MFSSYDIARFSDLVYSEVISKKQYDNLKLNAPNILASGPDAVFYKQANFSLNSGDVIFTHTGNLLNLFYLLKNLEEEYQLTLITHQSDTMIDKKLFDKKPICIKSWYALNVNYKTENLFSLPLGIANEYSYKKNITINNINEEVDIENYYKQNSEVYINLPIRLMKKKDYGSKTILKNILGQL